MSLMAKPGVGLRKEHYSYLLEKPEIIPQWFEVISENYMGTQGRQLSVLEKIREDYPIAMHGVSMSLGSHDPVNKDYLSSLKELISQIDPFIVSDHVAWTGGRIGNSHDLLPFPMNEESLINFVRNLNQAQDFLGRNIFIENPSTYMSFENSDISEWDFMREVAQRCSTKILLDVNNVYVASQNHKLDPMVYIDAIPEECIGQMHLAGFTDMGDYLFDTHSKPVYEAVWPLYKAVIQKKPGVPFMVEWDDDIPDFPVLEEELTKALNIWHDIHDDSNNTSEAEL
jgi:uncharacterized protein (UPF0276 family)